MICLAFSVGCAASSSSSSSTSPGSDQGDADQAGAADAPKTTRKPRQATGTKAAGSRKGVKRLKAKKPPRDPSDVKVAKIGDIGKPLGITSFVPTAASPGSAVEIFGGGFSDKAKVTVGGVSWKVAEATNERLVTTVPKNAKDGKIKVKVGNKTATSDDTFAALEDDGGFGKPSVDANHGLLGNVYVIGAEVTELPAFDDLGDPTAVIAVDTLDVPPRDFKQGFPGVESDVNEWFAIHFRGSLNIVEGQGGEYNLCMNSDDGSQLYLDENPVVDNDGVHGPKEKCELVYLEPGEYQVDVLYFQGPRYEIALQWSWAKDGGEKIIVPSEVLFRPRDRHSMGPGQ